MHTFGLIGFPLGHSFSKKYYSEKMERESIENIQYGLFSMENVDSLSDLITQIPTLSGVNVTIPHKVSVMDLLDHIDEEAKAIGAVNCIQIRRKGNQKPHLKGYNTDVYGFRESLRPLLAPHHTHALVLGNGGAAKAVCFALQQLGITYHIVARRPSSDQLSFDEIDDEIIHKHKLLINCTPLGTFPAIEGYPLLPYASISSAHLLYDLVYNPETTAFMQKGIEQGAQVKNGFEMLELQAERNWSLWMEVVDETS
jgi:shikimate dehydrogenase